MGPCFICCRVHCDVLPAAFYPSILTFHPSSLSPIFLSGSAVTWMNPSAPWLVTTAFLTLIMSTSSILADSVLLWWSAIAAVHAICCTREILTPFHSLPLQEACSPVAEKTNSWFSFWSGLQTVLPQRLNGSIIVCICMRANVWIISRSISIRLAPDIDRCLQEASSGPHGTLDHVGQIYGLMLPLTTTHPVTGDISEANRCNLSYLAQSQHFIGSFAFKW